MVILDNLGIHTPKGSRLLRGLLAELGEQLVLVYTPIYDPDANRIEWLWRALRRAVRSAARSRSTTGQRSRRNSTMQHELPGSI
jgi:transposase